MHFPIWSRISSRSESQDLKYALNWMYRGDLLKGNMGLTILFMWRTNQVRWFLITRCKKLAAAWVSQDCYLRRTANYFSVPLCIFSLLVSKKLVFKGSFLILVAVWCNFTSTCPTQLSPDCSLLLSTISVWHCSDSLGL